MRTELCLRAFNNYKNMKKNKIPFEYFNEYYGKKMELKVCDFYWACSYKSYLPCGQTCDIYSYDAIRDCLLAGARLINLDIYASVDDMVPIVRDKIPMPRFYKGLKTELDVEKCFKIIREYAWFDAPNYPLILHLNLHTNNRLVLTRLANLINKIFKGYLMNKRYSFSGRNGNFPFGQIPIAELFGNVAIVTDKYPTIGSLDEFINGNVSPDQKFITEISYKPSIQTYGGLISKNSNVGDMINSNKFNITFVNSTMENEVNYASNIECIFNQNFRSPKSDLYNADAQDCWNLGCQCVLMNYQLYDKNMQEYIKKFKNAGLVLKPDNLRYIPKPKEPIKQQSKKASYAPRTIGVPGWYSYNI